MKDLIAALTILLKYGNPDYPTGCEHDVMYFFGVSPDQVSEEDLAALDELGIVGDDEGFKSYKFGSA